MDLQADYGLRLGPVTVHFLASLFNVLNKQQTIQVDQRYNLVQFTDPNYICGSQPGSPDDLKCNNSYLQGTQWQQPRTLRLGLRVSF